MWNFLLDIVSGNGKPSFEVTAGDNIKAWFAENQGEATIVFIAGIIVGIIIATIIQKLFKFLNKE